MGGQLWGKREATEDNSEEEEEEAQEGGKRRERREGKGKERCVMCMYHLPIINVIIMLCKQVLIKIKIKKYVK